MYRNYLRETVAQSQLPDWDFYFCEVDDRPAIISVDLNLAGAAPHAMLPYLVYVSLKINKQSIEGFPAPSELGQLCRIEDHLLETIGERESIRFCGRVTTNGCRDLIFYVENPSKALALLEAALQAFPQYRFETGWKADAEWDLYFSFLFPNETELNTIFNQRVVASLQESGVPLTEKRSLQHTAHFADIDARDRFIVKLIDDYFRIEKVERDETKQQYQWKVNFERADLVSIEDINALTAYLLGLAHDCSGEYDGWRVL